MREERKRGKGKGRKALHSCHKLSETFDFSASGSSRGSILFYFFSDFILILSSSLFLSPLINRKELRIGEGEGKKG